MKYLFLLIVSLSLQNYVSAQQRIFVSVNSNQPPTLNASAGSDTSITGSDLTIGDTPTAIGGLAPYTYQWLPEMGLNDASTPNPIYSGDQPQSYSLIVTDIRGCTARDTINIVISGFPDVQNDDLLLVYPNPGAGMIRLKMKEGVKQSSYPIILQSASGQLVFNRIWENVKNEYLIDVSTLASGNYVISIGEGKGLITRKLMINK
jgi:hypothetical protein